MIDYVLVKVIHESAVTLSGLGFFARGAGALAGAGWVRTRTARSLPHIVDTVLLLSAVVLVWMLRIDPRAAPWLMAKIVALAVYIGLGIVALRPGLSTPVRATAWLAALATFAYIVSVAITKNPLGLFAAPSA